MLEKLPVRLRLTILSILLLSACCFGLTAILNLSANRMANTIEAVAVTPALPYSQGDILNAFPATETVPLEPIVETQAARAKFFNNSIFYMILVVVLGGMLTYYISGRALKSLQELNQQMVNRTVHNLSEVLPVPKSNDEIANLTKSFNEMSTKLEEAFAMQKRFSQSTAHELRTPLTVLKTKVDVFKKKENHTPEEYDKLLNVISTHTDRLADLVKDLLDLTNMDALDCDETISLDTMLTEIVDELSLLSKEKQLDISINGDSQTVTGNYSLLHRAFYNLVENAIKYNTQNGSVAITIKADGEHSLVTISDTGIGIPSDSLPLIFEPFYRVDKSRSREMGGAGLGLSTVKAILDKHGGTISVTPNKSAGTTFSIEL